MNQVDPNEMARKIVTILDQMSSHDLLDVLMAHTLELIGASGFTNVPHGDRMAIALECLLENLEGIRKLKEAGRN